MTLLQNLLILISLFTLPFGLFGQANENYENEEINVINHLLDKLVKEEKLSAINYLLSYQLGYLLTKQMSNLDKEPHLKGSYKSNKLLKKLENNYLGEKYLDSTKIQKFDKIKFVFESKSDYSTEKYDSDNIIGTINISRISFNKKLTIGYFYYNVNCGEDCGWGDLVKIKKKKGKWEITKYLISWVY